ncbi:hypothetical protein [Pseudodesulfovibrio senegalensis]|nr:hypothetical protein [Pseudodesulfovibrio senegalensis]
MIEQIEENDHQKRDGRPDNQILGKIVQERLLATMCGPPWPRAGKRGPWICGQTIKDISKTKACSENGKRIHMKKRLLAVPFNPDIQKNAEPQDNTTRSNPNTDWMKKFLSFFQKKMPLFTRHLDSLQFHVENAFLVVKPLVWLRPNAPHHDTAISAFRTYNHGNASSLSPLVREPLPDSCQLRVD